MSTHPGTMFSHGHALLIGVDQSAVPSLALPVVARDVAALAAVLADPGVCAYPREQIETMTGESVTRAAIFAALDRLRVRLQADGSDDATAVVYFSGHGWRRERGEAEEYYLIPHDIDPARPHRTALAAREFASEIAALTPRRLLVLLDCCHAHGMGAKAPALPGGPDAAFPIEILRDDQSASPVTADNGKSLSDLRQGRGRAVLSSSRGDEKSFYLRDESMSVFTHHLIEAFVGHAPNSAGQSQVLVSDILGYLARKVPETAHRECARPQHPDFHVSGNFPVAMLLGGKGLAPGQAAPEPRAIVRQAMFGRDSASAARHRVGDVSGQASVGDNNIQVRDVRANGSVAIGNRINIPDGRDRP